MTGAQLALLLSLAGDRLAEDDRACVEAKAPEERAACELCRDILASRVEDVLLEQGWYEDWGLLQERREAWRSRRVSQ